MNNKDQEPGKTTKVDNFELQSELYNSQNIDLHISVSNQEDNTELSKETDEIETANLLNLTEILTPVSSPTDKENTLLSDTLKNLDIEKNSILQNTSSDKSNSFENTSTEAEDKELEMSKDSITINIPPFTPNKINLWLKSVEGRLKAYGVKDEDLYRRIRMDMPIEIVERLPELIDPSTENDNFKYFKDELIKEYGQSREEEIRELLNKMSLNDEGPKRLMEKMIEKASSDIKPFVVADLFQSKLPKDVARLLVAMDIEMHAESNEDLRKIAEKAEKAYKFEENYLSPKKQQISAITAKTQNGGNKVLESDETKNLKKEVDDLRSRVNHLTNVVDKLLNSNPNSNFSESNNNF